MLTPLIGRDALVAHAQEAIRRHRVVTLTGPGGVGKTRLAIEVASGLIPEHPDGISFVDLSSTREPAAVLHRVAEVTGGDRPQEVIGHRRVLLILDNFEQVLDAASEIASLIHGCRNLRLLVTSRAPLRIRGEHRLDVEPLDATHSARLFVDRATAAIATAELETGLVSSIVDGLDGLPLAIELAAARAASISPKELRDRLGAHLDLLARGPRDLPDRHRTLRDTISWSYELLSAEGRAALRRLGVLAGDFDLAAALAVSESDIDGIAELVDHSLLRRDGERYSMLDSIAAFATAEAERQGEVAAARARHLAHYRGLPGAARRAGGVDLGRRAEWIVNCRTELANLQRAFDWAVQSDDVEAILELFQGMGFYWLLVGSMAEGTRWGRIAIDCAARAADDQRMRILFIASEFPRYGGSLAEAIELKRQSLQLARQLGHGRQVAFALDDIAWIQAAMGDDVGAEASLSEAMRVHEAFPAGVTDVAHTVQAAAEVALRAGDIDRAMRRLEAMAALEVDRVRTPDEDVERSTISGLILLAAGRTADAVTHLERAIRAGVPIGFRYAVADALDGLAAAIGPADPGRGARLVGMADRARAEAGSRPWLPDACARTRADLRARLGDGAYGAGHAAGHGLAFAAMVRAALPSVV